MLAAAVVFTSLGLSSCFSVYGPGPTNEISSYDPSDNRHEPVYGAPPIEESSTTEMEKSSFELGDN